MKRLLAHGKRNNGAILVITLSILVLITVLVVGIFEGLRIERGAADSHLERGRAETFAQMGPDEVIAALQQNTADPNRNWISQPGQIIVGGTGATDKLILTGTIPLHSGAATINAFTGNDAVYSPPNLNITTFRDPTIYLIQDPVTSGSAEEMLLNWIYIRKSGTLDREVKPAFSSVDPIEGRYAYWTDDESSKINYNLAWTRGTENDSNPSGHPTKINLLALAASGATAMTDTLADAIHGHVTTDNYLTSAHFYNTPEDARQVSTDVSTILTANKFEVTHYNHDPDTTFFNEPRIVLTTWPSRAGWTYDGSKWVGTNGMSGKLGTPPYIRILLNEGTDQQSPPDTGADAQTTLDPAKVADTVNFLNSYLQRTDWPIAPGASFQAKYYNGDPDRLTQLSLNIIEYVRSKESTADVVAPIRGSLQSGTFALDSATGSSTGTNAFIGVTRGPRITEMGLWVSGTAGPNGRYPGVFKAEVFLPPHFGIASVDLSKFKFLGSAIITVGNNTTTYSYEAAPSSISIPGGGNVLPAGKYGVISVPVKLKVGNTYMDGIFPRPPSAVDVFLRYTITLTTRIDITPLLDSSGGVKGVPCTLDAPGTLESDISSVEVDDPRVNSDVQDWKKRSGNSFGAQNARYSGGQPVSHISPAPPTEPQLDTDSSGNISEASFYMPAPAGKIFSSSTGQDNNLKGKVISVGELGYIHTGMESAGGPGVPWRTLRLQPSISTSLPDWALMDLFTVPPDVTDYGRPLFSPNNNTAIGGRINVNSKVVPFAMERIIPLKAALLGAMANSKVVVDADTVASNIYNRTLATTGHTFGCPDAYDSVGEICEIKGVADGGEESETLVRELGNLLTPRGNVFTVYSVGEAIKQTPNGSLIVTAQQRQQSMIERYVVDREVQPTSGKWEDTIGFRTVYRRNLNP
jgi:hypothetical protein